MSLVRLLGFSTLSCGCAIGRYRELATDREVVYIEERGQDCTVHYHRRNRMVNPQQVDASVAEATAAAKKVADEEAEGLGV